ncbi:hypothetical protein I4F81_003534 [Pyropia yezoensis]|uniref:Uncharacterized protein n=1 Tax=Pyropia yezoensis TaxID=2788 RepID=A0ACC3BSP9_PYRYE|nr:hypothetical protein I4F81_003534 [Neopyropia yezoensis]
MFFLTISRHPLPPTAALHRRRRGSLCVCTTASPSPRRPHAPPPPPPPPPSLPAPLPFRAPSRRQKGRTSRPVRLLPHARPPRSGPLQRTDAGVGVPRRVQREDHPSQKGDTAWRQPLHGGRLHRVARGVVRKQSVRERQMVTLPPPPKKRERKGLSFPAGDGPKQLRRRRWGRRRRERHAQQVHQRRARRGGGGGGGHARRVCARPPLVRLCRQHPAAGGARHRRGRRARRGGWGGEGGEGREGRREAAAEGPGRGREGRPAAAAAAAPATAGGGRRGGWRRWRGELLRCRQRRHPVIRRGPHVEGRHQAHGGGREVDPAGRVGGGSSK